MKTADLEAWKIDLGKRLADLRETKGLKLAKVARMAKIDRRHLEKVEDGTAVEGIRLHELLRIAEIYGVTITDICGDEKNEPDNDIAFCAAAMRSFSRELKQHYRFLFGQIQIHSEQVPDAWKKKSRSQRK